MNLSDVSLISMLREKMSWLNSRQGLLSQNVANADTPGYAARDLKPVDFEKELRENTRTDANTLRTTNPRHIAIDRSAGGFDEQPISGQGAADPNGNTVGVEEEMIKVADTQAQYQAAANIYAKTVSMMRTAIGH
jgi:flagellar basal-body rod protein FlgB